MWMNGKTKLDWKDSSQNKYFPVFKKDGSGRWVVHYFNYCWYSSANLSSGLYFLWWCGTLPLGKR